MFQTGSIRYIVRIDSGILMKLKSQLAAGRGSVGGRGSVKLGVAGGGGGV